MREEFKKLVIEAIHGLPYEEAIKKELPKWVNDENDEMYRKPYISIGRVMQAELNNENKKRENKEFCIHNEDIHCGCGMNWNYIIKEDWKLTKENGEECTDDDQSDETIQALLNLLKK